jgi:hypothetical protein
LEGQDLISLRYKNYWYFLDFQRELKQDSEETQDPMQMQKSPRDNQPTGDSAPGLKTAPCPNFIKAMPVLVDSGRQR